MSKMLPAEPAAELIPINRQVLHEAVVDRLRQMITEGTLSPGTHLNERGLCEALGVSRTPLREAIKVLSAEGLIEYLPNRGAKVVTMSVDDIADTFEVMSGLEALAGELACERITDAELNEIKALHAQMLACRDANDLSGYYQKNQAIHDHINQAARNNMLRQTYLNINRRIQALRFRSNFNHDKWDRAIRDHQDMITALDARDGDRLRKILRRHLLAKRDVVLEEIRRGA